MKIRFKIKFAAMVIAACSSVLGTGTAYAAGEVNYFRITKDMRTCAAPACGGVYATSMNTNVQYACPNGEIGTACYIGQFDTAALGHSPFDVSAGEPGVIAPISYKVYNAALMDDQLN
jgi:hypothetical protein